MAKWISSLVELRSFSVRRRRPGPSTTSGATPVKVRKQCLTQAEIDRMNALKTLKRRRRRPEVPPSTRIFWWAPGTPFSRRRNAVGYGWRHCRRGDFKYVENCTTGDLQASGPGGKYTAKIQ